MAKHTKFSIHDAFEEEENDEPIRVYGSTVVSNPVRSHSRTPMTAAGVTTTTDDIAIRIRDPK